MPNHRLAILRAHHDTAYPQITDAACIAMLMEPGSTGVLDYWKQVTNRQLTFNGSQLMPWVNISITDPKLPRNEQIRLALVATQQATKTDLGEFDGFVVLVHPGMVQLPNPQAGQPGQNPTIPTTMTDSGSGSTPTNKPACALHWLSRSHAFFCHEVGHVLGLKHSWGVPNTGSDWDQQAPWAIGNEYGDPVDIMSAEGWGSNSAWSVTSRPTFTLADPPGWAVTPPAGLPGRPGQSAAGPALAQAFLHWMYPDALPGVGFDALDLPQLNPHKCGNTRRIR